MKQGRCRHCGRSQITKADLIHELARLTGVPYGDIQLLSVPGAEGLLAAFKRLDEMVGEVVERDRPELPPKVRLLPAAK